MPRKPAAKSGRAKPRGRTSAKAGEAARLAALEKRCADMAAALAASEERQGLVMEAINEGIYDLDIATGEVFHSQRVQALLGLEPSDLLAGDDELTGGRRVAEDADAGAPEVGPLARRVGEMGMPLYLKQPPTGYADTAAAWVSTGGLVARLNFALDLFSGRVRGVSVDRAPIVAAAQPGAPVADILAGWLVPAGLSPESRRTVEAEVAAGLTPTRAAGLVLGSPEFQRR